MGYVIKFTSTNNNRLYNRSIKCFNNIEFNKDIRYKGIVTKITIFIMVAIICNVDKMLCTNGTFRIATIFFYIANEGLSIIKNISDMDTTCISKRYIYIDKGKNDKVNKNE